jgi:hypothetical protein
MTLRNLILDNVRRIALTALWRGDTKSWDRATDILSREGRRIQKQYTAQREVAHA